MGIWNALKPRNLSRREADHPWLFATYLEAPCEREDDYWYHAFLFRNEDRTLFGIKEHNDLIHYKELEAMAMRVVRDASFREGLLSEDPELPRLWKRR